jgi:hypothetical protein
MGGRYVSSIIYNPVFDKTSSLDYSELDPDDAEYLDIPLVIDCDGKILRNLSDCPEALRSTTNHPSRASKTSKSSGHRNVPDETRPVRPLPSRPTHNDVIAASPNPRPNKRRRPEDWVDDSEDRRRVATYSYVNNDYDDPAHEETNHWSEVNDDGSPNADVCFDPNIGLHRWSTRPRAYASTRYPDSGTSQPRVLQPIREDLDAGREPVYTSHRHRFPSSTQSTVSVPAPRQSLPTWRYSGLSNTNCGPNLRPPAPSPPHHSVIVHPRPVQYRRHHRDDVPVAGPSRGRSASRHPT